MQYQSEDQPTSLFTSNHEKFQNRTGKKTIECKHFVRLVREIL